MCLKTNDAWCSGSADGFRYGGVERGTTPDFLSKSAQTIDNKGREASKKLQESSRVRKPLKMQE
jgi:hypothetical protein